jgi:hypothetical protein
VSRVRGEREKKIRAIDIDHYQRTRWGTHTQQGIKGKKKKDAHRLFFFCTKNVSFHE